MGVQPILCHLKKTTTRQSWWKYNDNVDILHVREDREKCESVIALQHGNLLYLSHFFMTTSCCMSTHFPFETISCTRRLDFKHLMRMQSVKVSRFVRSGKMKFSHRQHFLCVLSGVMAHLQAMIISYCVSSQCQCEFFVHDSSNCIANISYQSHDF